MSGNRYIPTVFTALDVNASPLPFAKLYFYENNSTTPKNTWSGVDLSTPNEWPVLADASGAFTQDIFLNTDTYRIKLTDSSGVQQWLKNDCNTFNSSVSSSFPFVGAIVEFYGTQPQLDSAKAALWYLMDGTNGLPDLSGKFIQTCTTVGAIGSVGGTNADITSTGTVQGHALTIAEMPSHTHTTTAGGDIGAGMAVSAPNGHPPQYSPGTATGSQGGGASHTHAIVMDARNYRPSYYTLIRLIYLGY